MATTTNLGKVHVFPSEDSYNTNKGSVGANDLALVPIGTATTSEYGLTRLASEADVLSEKAGVVVHVPLAYELNDFRRLNTAYKVGDKVNCAFKFEYFLECTQAGTTSANTLDARNVTFGQTITDGTVKWIVRAHVKSVNGVVPDANGNVAIDAAFDSEVVHKAGSETITGKKTFGRELTVTGSTGYELQRTDRDFSAPSEINSQNWFLRLKDKNNLSTLLLKYYQYASGETCVTLSDINNYNGKDDWCTLSIGHNADGSRYIKGVYDPDKTISGYELITAKWLRAYIWDDERSQIVHTVNTQTIDGKKTFLQTPIVSANPMLRSEYWSDISIADTSRATTKIKMLAEVLDKDGKRWMGLETTANTQGQRQVQLIGRNRTNTNWINFIKFTEETSGTVTGYLANNTPSDAIANEVATAGYVRAAIKSVVLDTFFPIGSIYMDATGNVNPNTQFGGTWTKIKNRFLLASGTKSVGATGGEENVTLTTAQMPKHDHGGRNDMNITGTIAAGGQTMNPTLSGAFYNTNTAHDTAGDGHNSTTVAGFDASKSWTGSGETVGGGQAHNNMPPYQVVAVWKRTA